MSEHALCRHHILSPLNLCARPRKLLKYYLFSMGLWKHLDWRGATCSSIRALEVPFQVKLTKMPLVNPRLIESQSQSKSSQNKKFLCFYIKLELLGDFRQVWPKVWLMRALEILILIRLSEWVGTNTIVKSVKSSFQWLFMGWNWSQNGRDILKIVQGASSRFPRP